jgi:spore maturation protein CgeB
LTHLLRDNFTTRFTPESSLEDSITLYRAPLNASLSGRALRILFVAPKYDYGDRRRGLSIEENYFFHSLYHMGHELIRFDYMSIMGKHGRGPMNELLEEAAYRLLPDVIFCVLFKDELDADSVRRISGRGKSTTMNWFCDDHWRFDDFSHRWAPCFNWSITTARSAIAKYHAIGVDNVILSQWGCNQRLNYRLPLDKCYDVSFIGLPHGGRREVLSELRRHGITVCTWGYGWGGGRVSQQRAVELMNQSRINLNLSNASVGSTQQIKGRTFEIPGCGGFQLSNIVPDLESYYRIGEEIVCFEGINDLVDKIKYYLSHPVERQAIADAGYQRTLAEHTYDRRFKQVFDHAGLT